MNKKIKKFEYEIFISKKINANERRKEEIISIINSIIEDITERGVTKGHITLKSNPTSSTYSFKDYKLDSKSIEKIKRYMTLYEKNILFEFIDPGFLDAYFSYEIIKKRLKSNNIAKTKAQLANHDFSKGDFIIQDKNGNITYQKWLLEGA